MRKLIQGIHRFRKRYRSTNRELYRRLAEHGRSPGTPPRREESKESR